MAFTVDDFEDLVRLLEQRPEWRARLRELLLPRELLELPVLVRELSEVIRDMQTRMGRVEERLERVEIDLSEFRRETNERFEQVDRRFDQVDARLDRLDENVGWLRVHAVRSDTDLGQLKGRDREQLYRERARLFGHLVSSPVPLTIDALDDWLQERVRAGRLEPAEAQRILRLDIVFRGGDPADPEYLAVEVSWAVDESDVRRAMQRAGLLRKAGVRARPVVAGWRIEPTAVALAEREGVARVIEEELEAEDDAAFGISRR